MTKHLFFILLALCGLTTSLRAQADDRPTVARAITSLQFNLGAIHLVHERGVSDDMTLRLELGVRQQFRFNASSENSAQTNYYGLRPVVGLGGRYYYNLAKRADKGLTTTNNSGNFVDLLVQFRPDFFAYTTNDNINLTNRTNAIARWGMRRQLGRRFDFEFSVGANLRPGRQLLGRRSIIGGSRPVLGWRLGYRF